MSSFLKTSLKSAAVMCVTPAFCGCSDLENLCSPSDVNFLPTPSTTAPNSCSVTDMSVSPTPLTPFQLELQKYHQLQDKLDTQASTLRRLEQQTFEEQRNSQERFLNEHFEAVGRLQQLAANKWITVKEVQEGNLPSIKTIDDFRKLGLGEINEKLTALKARLVKQCQFLQIRGEIKTDCVPENIEIEALLQILAKKLPHGLPPSRPVVGFMGKRA